MSVGSQEQSEQQLAYDEGHKLMLRLMQPIRLVELLRVCEGMGEHAKALHQHFTAALPIIHAAQVALLTSLLPEQASTTMEDESVKPRKRGG